MSFRRFFNRSKWDRERRAEIESYLQMETDENIARGMNNSDARAAAKKKLGNGTRIREEIYRMNTVAWLDSLSRDIRYALRGLRRNPTFTAVALLTLAIGIGANTAVFSVVNSVLLKPLNYPQPEELVAVRQVAPGAAGLASFSNGLPLSASMYFTYAEQNKTFQALGVWSPFQVNVTGLGEPEQVRGVAVSRGVLEALNVKPLLGRWLNQDDQTPAGPVRAMLTYGYWQRRFGGDRNVIGRAIDANSSTTEIVGVMPQGFRILDADFDLIVPFQFDRSKLSLPGFGLQGVGRLKPGVTIAQANADIAGLVSVWMRSWSYPGDPKIYETWRITPALRPLKAEVVRNIGDVLWLVMATIGLVMVIACANVANLLLVRAEARQQELAVRSALGAAWGRIVHDLLIESLVLAVIGGAIGTGLAYEGLRLLAAAGPGDLPRLSEISLDGRALAFSVALSLLSGMLFGFIPAWKYAKARLALGGRTFSTSRERNRARNILVVAQVAMALVLLVSAGLMIRTFGALRTVKPGFAGPEHLQTMIIGISTAVAAKPEQVTRIENDIADKLATIPGVSSAGFASALPMDMSEPNWDAVFAEGQTFRAGEIPPLRDFQYVSPGFLKTAGTRMIAGRDFTWPEVYGRRAVAMLSENLAREFWKTPGAAVGKHIRQGPGSPVFEVIGVVEDVRERGVDQKAPETVYWPTLGNNVFGGSLRLPNFMIRSDRAGTASLLEEIRQAVWSVNSNLPVSNVRTMKEIYSQSVARTSFTLVMLAIAGAMALLLGVVGIYGVIAYAVSQRWREIGIRLALGAQQGKLKTMFVQQALALAGIGVAIGLGASALLMQLMKSLLFGVSPLDPLTYAAVPMVLAVAAALASYIPARRAAAVDPVEALRAE